MKRLLLVLAFLALPAFAHAQATTAIRVVVSGGASPVTNDLPLSGWLCGQVKVATPSGTVHNPSKLQIDDFTDTTQPSTKACTYTDDGTGPLLTRPFGATVYTATAAFLNIVGPGPVSNVSNPFDRPGTAPTAAPTGLKALP